MDARTSGVSRRNSSTVTRARRGVPVHCPAGTKSLPDTMRIAGSSMTSLRHRKAAPKKSEGDITRISCFVTTMKLPHALQIYSTVFYEEVHAAAFFKVVQQQTVGKAGNSIIFVGRYFLSATVKELLKSDNICKSYAQMKKGQFFYSQCIFLFELRLLMVMPYTL